MRKICFQISSIQHLGGVLVTLVFSGLFLAACSPTKLFLSDGVTKAQTPSADAIASQIHKEILIIDGHADVAVMGTSGLYLGRDGKSKVSLEKLRNGSASAVVMSIAVPPGARSLAGDAEARALADQKLNVVKQLISNNPDDLLIATSAEQVRSAKGANKIAILLGLQNARLLERDEKKLDEFYAHGVRLFSLNHLGHNEFSDSSRPQFNRVTGVYEPASEHDGLSELGVAAVKRINQLGGVLDVSQSSKAATLQIIDLSRSPVIASHSNVRSLSNVSRNLSDEEIDRIGQTGGVINVTPFGAYLVDYSNAELLGKIKKVRADAGLPETYSYPYELYWEIADADKKLAFLSTMKNIIGSGDVARLVDHIDYIVTRIGINHVGIGSDFNHGGGVEGFNEVDEALNVTTELVRRGYSKAEIAKIWGDNFLRVLQAAERNAVLSK